MARHREPLNGGLVTNLDPALLEPGQLSYIRNGVYKSGSQSLHRAKGRAVFGTVSATGVDVDGLRDAKFDNGDHYLIAHATGSYMTATVGDTGTFGFLASGMGDGEQLDVAHFRNRFYLFNGVQTAATAAASNRVLYVSATGVGTTPSVRFHGLLPVESPPAITTAGGGTFSQTVTGYYEYWTTEVAKYTQDGAESVVESTFIGKPATVFISATSVVPTIFLPTLMNPGATTHWRIYRSPKKDVEADKVFPAGFMIADIATATASQPDTSTVSTTSYIFPVNFNASPNAYIGAVAAQVSSLGADDNAYTQIPGPTSLLIGPQMQGCYGFNFGGFKGNVRGIEVEIQAFVSGSAGPIPTTVKIGPKRNSNGEWAFYGGNTGNVLGGGVGHGVEPVARSVVVTATSTPGQTLVLGSSSDRWVASDKTQFSDADFDANWMLTVGHSTLNQTLAVDYVKARVHYAGTTDSQIVFPTVVYNFSDLSIQVGKNGPPPSSSTGDFYEDSLVVNDVNNPSLIRWSFPGEPESFPSTYFDDIETRNNDRVTAIKAVNDTLIVGLESGVCRYNYLPSERDASFEPGKARNWITRTFGIVNPMCACVYSPNENAERLAFVSNKGIHSTDGFDFTDLISLDWRRVISITSTSTPIALINDPEESELLFYYRNDSNGSETYLCLHLNYGSDHTQPDGTLKVSGPVHVRNHSGGNFASLESAWTVPRSSGSHGVYLGYGGTGLASAAGSGKVYFETGSTIPALDPSFAYRTRRMFLAGESNEWKADEVYNYFPSHTGSQTVSYTMMNLLTNATGEASESVINYSLAGQTLTYVAANQQAEGLRIECAITSGHDDLADEFLIIEGQDFGQQDSKR